MPRSGRILYLAYGSNLHPLRLNERLGSSELVTTVALPGWRLRFDKRGADGSAKANLRPAPGSDHEAWAVVYDVSASQLLRLDRFEGWGSGYETVWFEVTSSSRQLQCLTYLAPSHWQTAGMLPFDWYRLFIAAGARHHGFPKDYVQAIARGQSMSDPDRRRSRSRHEMLSRM